MRITYGGVSMVALPSEITPTRTSLCKERRRSDELLGLQGPMTDLRHLLDLKLLRLVRDATGEVQHHEHSPDPDQRAVQASARPFHERSG